MSESDALDSAEAERYAVRDSGGLLPVQREQLDRLLIETGDDPHLTAALSAMFFISLHQDNTVKQHIVAHREALRDDVQEIIGHIADTIHAQHLVINDVMKRLDDADKDRHTTFIALEDSQEHMRDELRTHGSTLRAQAWTLWAIGGAVFLLLIIGMAYMIFR
jgi:hypothetical protein